jgi:hypothetical protein
MYSRRRSLSRHGPRLLALLIVLCAATQAPAQAIRLASEVPGPVVVQVTAVFKGRLYRSEPVLLKPGASSPAITLPGDRIITIYDARAPNVVLFRDGVPAGTDDLYLAVIPNKGKMPVTLEKRKPPPKDK